MNTLQPQQESFVWSGWVLAIALLGLEELSNVVRQAFERGLIEPRVMGYDDFRRDLQRTLAIPSGWRAFTTTGSGRWRMRLASSRAGTLSPMRPSRIRRGRPAALGMAVWPMPTCPSRLLTRSRVWGGTTPAHVAAARSSRSAASIEDLSRTSDRVSWTKTALRVGAVSSHSDPWSS